MRDTIFLYIIAILAFGFGFINFIQYLLKRNQTAQVVGTIISIKTPNPQNSKFRNSKSQVGTTISVRYDINHPEKLYSFSVSRIVVSFLIAVVCAALAMSNFM